MAVVAASDSDLATKLVEAAGRIESSPAADFSAPNGLFYGCEDGLEGGGLAFLFPGQGSQYIDMGASVAMQLEAALAVWNRAAGRTWDGQRRVHELVFPPTAFADDERAGQEAALAATEWAQPRSAARAWRCCGSSRAWASSRTA